MVQCIFGHVGSISRDFVDSNRALSNLHGKWFGFSHTLGHDPPNSCRWPLACFKFRFVSYPP
jgi:hypothetical protein